MKGEIQMYIVNPKLDELIDNSALCASEAIEFLANKHNLPIQDIMTHIVRDEPKITSQFRELVELGLDALSNSSGA